MFITPFPCSEHDGVELQKALKTWCFLCET